MKVAVIISSLVVIIIGAILTGLGQVDKNNLAKDPNAKKMLPDPNMAFGFGIGMMVLGVVAGGSAAAFMK